MPVDQCAKKMNSRWLARYDLEVIMELEWRELVTRGHVSHFLEVQGQNE